MIYTILHSHRINGKLLYTLDCFCYTLFIEKLTTKYPVLRQVYRKQVILCQIMKKS